MTVGEFFGKIGSTISKSVSQIADAVMKADLISLLKVGVVVGTGIATIVAIVRYIKQRKKVYANTQSKNVVDEALDLNYADVRKQDKLHPLMKKVRKNLTKDLKPRMKKSSSKKKKAAKERTKYKNFIKNLNVPKREEYEEEEYDFAEDFEIFKREMREQERMEQEDLENPKFDPYRLRNVWEFS